MGKDRCWGRRLRYESFADWLRREWQSPNNGRLSDLNYEHKLRYAVEVFGDGSFGIFVYENLKKDASSYLKQLSAFLGVDETQTLILADAEPQNVRMNALHFHAFKHICKSPRLALKFRFSTKSGRTDMVEKLSIKLATQASKYELKWPDGYEDKLTKLARPGNRYIAEQFQIDLAAHGYPI